MTKQAVRFLTQVDRVLTNAVVTRKLRDFLTEHGYERPAKMGGTYLHCDHPVERTVPKRDSLGRKTRWTTTEVQDCGRRFRRAKTYRRHWRKAHGIKPQKLDR